MKTEADGFNRILEVLGLLEIPYQVVGSLASSMHGIPRATMDVGLVVKLRPDQIGEFAAALKADFYADPESIKEALARHFPIVQSRSYAGRSLSLQDFKRWRRRRPGLWLQHARAACRAPSGC